MTNSEYKWLPHLENAIPSKGYGNRLSMYLIALEAWRRGISVRFYLLENPENKMLIRYVLSYNDKEHYFESSLGDKISEETFRICENKDEAIKYLARAKVPVPTGKRFGPNVEDSSILEYAKKIGYPVVLKPRSGNAGRGVFANIKDKASLESTLTHVRKELGLKDVILEEYIPGIEYRVFVVNGEIIGAVNRIPANVIGNGKNTIKELIKIKNEQRKNNPNIANKPISIDKEILNSIRSQGYELDTVLEKDKKIFLRNKSNVSMGGDPVDVTDQLTDKLKAIAVNAVNAIPGLGVCGLDMIVDQKNNTGTVIEINTKPMLGLHLFPVQGKAHDVVKPIVDYYFPETMNNTRTNLYFDFEAAISPIRNRITKSVEVSPPPYQSNLISKKLLVVVKNGTVSNYRRWVRLEALKKGFHGSIKRISNNKVEIIIAGPKKEDLNEFKNLCLKGPKNTIISKVKEHEWDKPIKIGFEICRRPKDEINDRLRQKLSRERKNRKRIIKKNRRLKRRIEKFTQKYDKKVEESEKYKKEKEIIFEEKIKLAKQYEEILQSRSWKITSPLRWVTGLIKKHLMTR